jgi:hypothetical protein
VKIERLVKLKSRDISLQQGLGPELHVVPVLLFALLLQSMSDVLEIRGIVRQRITVVGERQ